MAANPNFPDVTYAGERYIEVFGETILDPAGLGDLKIATLIDKQKFKTTINEITDTVVLQNATPQFNDQNTQASMPEINVVSVPYEFHKMISLDDLRKSWLSPDIPAGSLEDYNNAELVDMYLQRVYIPKLKLANAHLIARGKTGLDPGIGAITFSQAYSGVYELLESTAGINKKALTIDQATIISVAKGVTTTLTAASGAFDKLEENDIVSVRGATGTGWTAMNGDFLVLAKTATTLTIDFNSDALTNANYGANTAVVQFVNFQNIVRVLSSALNSVPTAVRRSPDTKIILPSHLELAWQFANAQVQQNGGDYYLSSYQLQMINKQIVFLDNAPVNTVGIWHPSRVFQTYDLIDDYSRASVVWLGNVNDFRYSARIHMKSGVMLTKSFTKEIFYARPAKL